MVIYRENILSWMKSLNEPVYPPWVYRHSYHADATTFSSCFAVFLLSMLDGLDELPEENRKGWSEALLNLQDQDTGLFSIGDLPVDRDSGGHDKEYVTWQLTTFCLSALAELDRDMPARIALLDAWRDPDRLRTWLDRLPWEDPWCVGNRVMFLCIMLLWDSVQFEEEASRNAVDCILDWHDEHQRPDTGFWGDSPKADFYEGMGGALHQYLIYFYTGRPVDRPWRIVDQILRLQERDGMFYPGMGGDGCLDYDAVDLLVKFHHTYDYRREDIRYALELFLEGLKGVEAPEGGFLWNTPETYRWYDWANHARSWLRNRNLYCLCQRYRTLLSARIRRGRCRMPQGWTQKGIPAEEPDLFATFMRTLAAGLALEVVEPNRTPKACNFLKTPGLGWHFTSPALKLHERKEQHAVARSPSHSPV